ncbi:Hypothetical protein I596_141 [Dokdonella koreensis DS-123]|uniref:Uncharacterized protein n=1 Tax=Dokdonella koreensis DS-123 TaxID=1300342 RepID=A0A167G5Q3_9GAMM|nr:Hypothetical protein I596_141 [Dokdonella koreensis DS-123]
MDPPGRRQRTDLRVTPRSRRPHRPAGPSRCAPQRRPRRTRLAPRTRRSLPFPLLAQRADDRPAGPVRLCTAAPPQRVP